MARLLMITALIASMLIHTKVHAQCERNLNVSMSTSLGIDKNGWTEGMEFGVWGVDQPFGVMGGFIMNNRIKSTIERGKAVLYKEAGIDGVIRLTAKVYSDDIFYHVLTTYVTTSSDIGFSYRLYKQFGDHVVIGLEPSVSFKNGGAVQTVFTFNF